MVQAVGRRPRTAEARVRPMVNALKSMVNRVAMGEGYLRVLSFLSISIIPPKRHTLLPEKREKPSKCNALVEIVAQWNRKAFSSKEIEINTPIEKTRKKHSTFRLPLRKSSVTFSF
jgi:hypothetical protein